MFLLLYSGSPADPMAQTKMADDRCSGEGPLRAVLSVPLRVTISLVRGLGLRVSGWWLLKLQETGTVWL